MLDESLKRSFTYRNIVTYRLVMHVLFPWKYTRRFKKVIELINPSKEKSVVELCFGDVYIAEWCKVNGLSYVGFDINPSFVATARSKGYAVELCNLRTHVPIPKCDVAILMGSLYHFQDILEEFIDKIMSSTNRLIITEPIRNLSCRNDFIGYIAKRSANPGQGHEHFRFNEQSLIKSLEDVSKGRYRITYIIDGKEAIIELLSKQVIKNGY